MITANYDAGRTGLVYRGRFRRAAAELRNATHSVTPGWLGWIALATVWLIVVAVLRTKHHHPATIVGITQFVPTALLVIAFAALIDLGTAEYGPAANDNGSGAGVAASLARALAAAPPGQMDVELVLAGAGEAGGAGLRRYLRRAGTHDSRGAEARWRGIPRRVRGRPELDRTNAAVLAFAASGAGQLHYWTSDGSLLPLRYSKRFRELCAGLAPELGARPHIGRGASPAQPTRLRGIPAITLGCLDPAETTPFSHQRDDSQANLDPDALDATVEFALLLVDALDSFLATTSSTGEHQPAVVANATTGERIGGGADA